MISNNEKYTVLKDAVSLAQLALKNAEEQLILFESLPENNKFANLEAASNGIEGKLYAIAEQGCEGAYNFGLPEYTQQFYVNNVLYEGKLEVEYNRHDKTYYFIDEHKFTYKEIQT